jgi:hypothetical protein
MLDCTCTNLLTSLNNTDQIAVAEKNNDLLNKHINAVNTLLIFNTAKSSVNFFPRCSVIRFRFTSSIVSLSSAVSSGQAQNIKFDKDTQFEDFEVKGRR